MDNATRVTLLMLSEIQDHLGIRGAVDTQKLQEALRSGFDWYVEEWIDVCPQEPVPSGTLGEVQKIMGMWRDLESSFDQLSQPDQATVGARPAFQGFDGNNEGGHRRVALFLIDREGLFTEFAGRELNTHMPSLDNHRSKLHRYQALERENPYGPLTADEIGSIMA